MATSRRAGGAGLCQRRFCTFLYLCVGWLQPALPTQNDAGVGGDLVRAGTWCFTMAARKKVLLKVIILGDSGYAHAHTHRHTMHTH